MKSNVLLLSLLVVTLGRYSHAVGELSCEAVSSETAESKPACRPVSPPDECVKVRDLDGSAPPGCSTDLDACSESSANYQSVVLDDGGKYRITGLPNYAEDDSSIGYCPSAPDGSWNTGGCLPLDSGVSDYHVEDLSISYSPVDTFHYSIVISWTYPEMFQPPPGAAYRLLLEYPGEVLKYCVCINSTLKLTEHSVIVKFGHGFRNFVKASMVTFPHRNRYSEPSYGPFIITPLKNNFPVNCSDRANGLPYNASSCAIPFFGKPRNVRAQVSEGYTRLSWDKPCFRDPNACQLLALDPSAPRPGLDTYYLTATVDNTTHRFIVQNTTEVNLSTVNLEDFKLYTQTPCSEHCQDTHFANGCSDPATADSLSSDTCCESPPPHPSTTTQSHTSTVTPSPPLRVNRVRNQGPIIGSVVAVLVLATVLVVVLIAVCYHYRKKSGNKGPIIVVPPSPPPSPLLPCSALVVFSPRTGQLESQTILQSLIADLRSFNVETSAYGTDQLRQSPTDWIVERHAEADVVLCVCNREFLDDWNDTAPDFDDSPQVVKTLRVLFEGDMQQGPFGIRNYAVIKMRTTDVDFIPPLLKARPDYMYHDTTNIARFAHNKPVYEF